MLAIHDAQATGADIKPISLKASIDTDILESAIFLCDFGDDVDDIAQLTEEHISAWLSDGQGESLSDLTKDEIDKAVKANVHIRMSESDASFRIKSLFMTYHKFLCTKKWDSLISECPKVATGHICMLLKPERLRLKIESDLELTKKPLRKNWKGFCRYVTQEAVLFDKYAGSDALSARCEERRQPSSARTTSGSSKAPGMPSTKSPSSGNNANKNKQNGVSSNKQKEDSSEEYSSKGDSKKDSKRNDTKNAPKCLNEQCDSYHFLRDCKITPDDMKKKLLQEFKENKRKSNVSAITQNGNVSEELGVDLPPGRLSGRLADIVPIIINGDYGADLACMSEHHLAQCQKHGIFIQTLVLTEPVEVDLAMQEEGPATSPQMFSSSKKVRLTTTIDTLSGPLRLRNVEYLVFPHAMKEVLLSRPLLQTLEFDLPSHLSSVRAKFHDADFSNIGFSPEIFDHDKDEAPAKPGTLASVMMSRSLGQCAIDEVVDISAGRSSDEKYLTLPDIVGDECPEETETNLHAIIASAVENGLDEDHTRALRDLVFEYKDIFRSRLGGDPPVQVPPMKILIKPGSKPFKAKRRNYSPQQALFLREKVDELLRLGLAYRNPNSRWASAPLIVRKPGPDVFRFTVDLRAVNALTEKIVWPMPHIDTLLSKLSGSNCFFTIDLCHGYFQMPLHSDSQECQSFYTAEEIVTPTRVLQGQANAVFYFQSAVQELFLPLRDELLQWLDDILGHAKGPSDLISKLRRLFDICRKHNLKLHSRKCRLYLIEANWCGRLISGEGIK